MIQLDFFENDEVLRLKDELRQVKESSDKVRKALFARHGQLAKAYLELHQRLDIIERNICLGKIIPPQVADQQ
jgi:hypothetical protein